MTRAAAWATPERVAAPLLIALGAVSRAAHYASNRPLWNDETALALNVMLLPFAELRGGLAGEQVAPLGFLVAEKLVASALGPSEWALRLVPFVASLASLWLFWQVARRWLEPTPALWALALFAADWTLVYYAAEAKQYSTDVLAALAVWRVGHGLHEAGVSGRRLLVAAVVGAAAPWLSHPAIFVCAGVGLAWQLAVPRGQARRRARLLAVSACWLASFALEYLLVLRSTPAVERLQSTWKHAFMPLLPDSLDAWSWFPRTFVGVFADPLALGLPALAALVFALGCGALALRNRPVLASALAPVGFALLASAARLYPFATLGQLPHIIDPEMFHPPHGRFLLFSVPVWIAGMAAGLGLPWASRRPGLRWAAAVAGAALLWHPALAALRATLEPPRVHDVRSLVDDLMREHRPGEAIVAIPFALPLEYYLVRRGWRTPFQLVQIQRPDDLATLDEHLASAESGARYWVVTVEHPRWPSRALRERAEEMLGERGEPLREIRHFRASARLFRLGAQPPGNR